MTDEQPLSEEFIQFLAAIKGKRSRVVIEHILQHGFITTEDLETVYGYSHPPRAIRDVREQGVPIETFQVKNAQGRTIAAYRFGNPEQRRNLSGRQAITKDVKTQLLEQTNGRCAVCQQHFDRGFLQVDHRVPYEISGEVEILIEGSRYMLLCAACNRTRSWACEHCTNWLSIKDSQICLTCYWAHPEQYEHVAMQAVRRLDLTWTDEEVSAYEQILWEAKANNVTLAEYVKGVLKRDEGKI